MKLKFKVSDLNEVPEAFRALYIQQQDGSFLLGVDGAVDKGQLDEFRSNNIGLSQQKEQLEQQLQQLSTKFGDLDPEQAREAMEMMNKIRDQKLIEEGKIEELIEARTKDMLANHSAREQELTKAVKEWESKHTSLHNDFTKLKIGSDLLGALSKVGKIHDSSRGIITDLAAQTWKLDEAQKLVAMNGDQPVYSPTDATKKLSPDEWAVDFANQYPYLFETTTGISAGQGGQGGQGGGQIQGYIAGDDSKAFEDNLEAIAAGTIQVR